LRAIFSIHRARLRHGRVAAQRHKGVDLGIGLLDTRDIAPISSLGFSSRRRIIAASS
jgi:hypothetical protein